MQSSESLKKLRKLTEELNDRDNQLKVNSRVLWDVQEGLCELRDLMTDAAVSNESLVDHLDELITMIDANGCKRCQ